MGDGWGHVTGLRLVIMIPTEVDIAKVCHEANRAYCQTIGDHSQLPWEEAPDWQRQSAIAGVVFRLAHPNAPISEQHESWKRLKVSDGWVYGPVKDSEQKTHPCLVSYNELGWDQQTKDYIFTAIVGAMTHV